MNVSLNVRWTVGLGVALLAGAAPARSQAGEWVPEQCGLKPGHFLVNSGAVHLKYAVESRFEDQRQKKLADARAVLTQAVTTGGQQDNPAAWYYLGRYYLLTQDLDGADTALARAERLRPECVEDIATWRRAAWVPVYNAGVAAWKAGNTDSAMAAFRRANAFYRREPQGMLYLAVLHANAGESDSAIKYFRLGIDAAGADTAVADEKKQAVFNLARVYHRAGRLDEAARAYRDYLRDQPNDAEATAGLASIYAAMGQRDSAAALYRRVLARADSVPYADLFLAGVQIYRSVPAEPDTGATRARCGTGGQAPAAARRYAACRDSLASEHAGARREAHGLAAAAFGAVLAKNSHYRDALYNLANVYFEMADTARLLPVAQRLVAVDPLNRASLRLLAQAFQFAGKPDSALHYLRVAEALPVEVTVTEVALGEKDATVAGLLTNFHDKPSPALTLVFELLDGKGTVVATKTLAVPAIGPQSNHPFSVEAQGSGIVAYRYRRQA